MSIVVFLVVVVDARMFPLGNSIIRRLGASHSGASLVYGLDVRNDARVERTEPRFPRTVWKPIGFGERLNARHARRNAFAPDNAVPEALSLRRMLAAVMRPPPSVRLLDPAMPSRRAPVTA